MITDLEAAESSLPQSYESSDLGRATKGAAATLLAKVQLTKGDNGAAEAALRRVMGYGYSLVPDYANLWGVDNEYNSESIFEVDFEGGFGDQG